MATQKLSFFNGTRERTWRSAAQKRKHRRYFIFKQAEERNEMERYLHTGLQSKTEVWRVEPITDQIKKTVQGTVFFIWYAREDLNLHILADTST